MALTGNNSNAIDEWDYFGGILLLKLDLGVEQFEPLYARLASIVEDQIFGMPAFLSA